MTFRDHFSSQAATYRKFRPTYPDELFKFLASVSPGREEAWDCATGNGQAAIALTEYFDHVTATDASEEQIKLAIPDPKITYRVALSESSDLDDKSQDLITVANALHWFDMDAFYQEAHRVLKPHGVIAAWCYEAFTVDDNVSPAFQPIYKDLKPFWPPQIKLVSDRYQTIDFPFEELQHPEFVMKLDWDLSQCLGYMSSWSAVQAVRKEKGRDPIAEHFDTICDAWGGQGVKRTVTWAVHFRVGRT